MDNLNTYTSTGMKFVRHHRAIKNAIDLGIPTPISLQIAPTSRCNLNCIFCSNVNRSKHEDLDPERLIKYLGVMRDFGALTVEWTGGGDPTCYDVINEMILLAKGLGYQQGFITNGTLLKQKLSKVALDCLTWIRVSMNCLDYTDEIDLENVRKTLGFSYVLNDKTNSSVLARLHDHVEKYRPDYVRMIPNCQATHEEQRKNNSKYSNMVMSMGHPYFYQAKTFRRPQHCWWGYFKPFLLHDEWIYPCSSVILNEDAEKQFHKKYRWYRMDEIENIYGMPNEMKSFDTDNCTHCVFTNQNEMIDLLVNPNEMVNFI